MTPGTHPTLQLRDIHLPPEPAFWPPAPGWWIVTILSIVLAIWLWKKIQNHLTLKKRCQEILSLLDNIDEQKTESSAVVSQLSIFMRQLALMRYPQKQVASLSGKAWLDFLDETGGNGQFTNGPGHILADGPYKPVLKDVDTNALKKLVRHWTTHNCRLDHEH